MKNTPAVAIALFAAVSAGPAGAAVGQLSKNVLPLRYDIQVDPNAGAKTFVGQEVITVKIAKATRSIVLNATELTITSAMVDGRKVAFSLDDANQRLTLRLPVAAKAGAHKLSFKWKGLIHDTAAGMFAIDYKNPDGSAARMLVTQFEAPDARRFAPMFDEPSFKARFKLSAVAPKGQTAFSNMPGTSTVIKDGRLLYSFAETPIMSSYLLFLGMGDVERKTVMAGKTEIGIITRRGVADQGDYALAQAKRLLSYYNDYFGQPYPLPKLDMIAGPGSSQFFGAMENWGAIFYFEPRVLFDEKRDGQAARQDIFRTVAHEMAHQWFGDLVTMDWWDDIWLNEGFASWHEGKASNDLNPQWFEAEATVAGGREAAMGIDATAATHPVIRHVTTVDQLGDAFDGITYMKGEAVIRMLESTLGADVFRDGIRRYMAKYKYKNTVTEQLWAELAAAAGKPVADVAHDFTLQGGVPLVSLVSARCVDGKTDVMLQQGRFGLDAVSKKPQSWHVPMTLGVVGSPVARTIVAGSAASKVSVDGCGTLVLNHDKGSYARVRYDDATHAALVRDYAKLGLADRLGTLGDDYALAVSGDQDMARYFDVASAVGEGASPLEWQTLAGDFGAMTGLYLGTPMEAPLRARAVERLAPVLRQIGLTAAPNEAPLVTSLRETLLGLLGGNGDADTLALARQYVAALAKDESAIPPTIRNAILGTYAINATPAEWDALLALTRATTNPVVRNEYIRLLGFARNAALAQRGLDLLKSDELTAQQKAGLLSAIASGHPDLAFDYAVANLDMINGLLETSSRANYVVGLGARSNDPAMPGKIMAFAEKHLPAEARGGTKRALSRIAVRRQTADQIRPAVAKWLGMAG